MDYSNYKDSIFIVKDEAKESIIKDICNEKKLLNIKIITLSELKKNYCFDYGNEAIHTVAKKYDVKSEIAKKYIENAYFIKDIDNAKVKFIKEIKDFLIKENLITFNNIFHNFLTDKRIILIDLNNVDKFYENIFEELKEKNNIEIVNFEGTPTKKKLFKAKNKEEEIAFVASQICSLIKSGIDINKIKLANVQKDYIYTIKNIFSTFNIPIILPRVSAMGTTIISKFIESYQDNMEECLDNLKDYVLSENDKKIYDDVIRIINNYAWCENYSSVKEELIEDIKKIKLPQTKYKNAVEIVDFTNDIFNDEYIFLINFNLGVIPVCAKDEDYFSNSIKKQLGISDSIELNKKRIEHLENRIKYTKNLVVSYSESNLDGKLYISSAYNEILFDEETCKIDYTFSNAYNKQRLVSFLDNFKKFGTIDEMMPSLYYNYSNLPYQSYKNEYNLIDKNKLYDYLGNKLTLSYTSVDSYFKCAYRYYLEYILNLSEFESRLETIIGNIFHKVLSKCYEENFNFDLEYENACNEEEYEFDACDKHFLTKLKENLLHIVETLKTQEDHTLLKKKILEKRVIVQIDKKHNILFKGIIDKINYNDFDNTKIASIVDYKTGDANINLNNLEYGLSLQLPAYAYLLKHMDEFKEARLGGFYLQKLFEDDKLKLSGYSNSNIEVLEKVDTTYANSNLINGLKAGTNGLYKTAKVLTDEQIDELCELVDEKIKEAANNIINANFAINPKEIKNVNVGCKFCKYKSICYMKNDDIVKIGGESDAEVDE